MFPRRFQQGDSEYWIKIPVCSKNRADTRSKHILVEARIWRKKKTPRRLCAEGRGGGGETEETGSRSEGASQLAHTSPLERPREGKRGPGTGNLLLYTRPEIRMYHSRTHVGARARAHERPVVGLIHTGPIVKTTMESSARRKSIYDQRAYIGAPLPDGTNGSVYQS